MCKIDNQCPHADNPGMCETKCPKLKDFKLKMAGLLVLSLIFAGVVIIITQG